MATLFDKQSDAILQSAQIQAQAISNAAAIQQQMAREALEFQKEQSNIARQTLQPYVTAGNAGTQRLMDLLGIGGTAARDSLSPTTGAQSQEALGQKALEDTIKKLNADNLRQVSGGSGSLPKGMAGYDIAQLQGIIGSTNPAKMIQAIDAKIAENKQAGSETIFTEKGGEQQFDLSGRVTQLEDLRSRLLDNLQAQGVNIQSLQQSAGVSSQQGQTEQPFETALQAQQRVTNELLNDPVFQGQINTGMQAIERSAAARGGLNSGRLATGLQAFGQQSAGNYIQQHIQNLQGLSGIGVGAAGGQANISYNTGSQGAGILNQLGGALGQYALASGQVSAAANLATSPASELAFNLANAQANIGGLMQAGGLGGSSFGFMGGSQGSQGGFF